MNLFSLPAWIMPHLYPGKRYADLSHAEISHLKERLSNFNPPNPEVSVVIPAWNEADHIFRTLSSLASNLTPYSVEIVVVNNNSSDHTQAVLDELGVRSYFQPLQGIAHARQLGLESARGKFHLCADADTFYPPQWVSEMVRPMTENAEIVGVYGRYSFIPPEGQGRLFWFFYETIAGLLIRLRKANREHLNVLGFTMGFVTKFGLTGGGFNVKQVRKGNNTAGQADFVDESEDGRMAVNLKTQGRLMLVSSSKARVFTSSRRLISEGGLIKSFINRLKIHSSRFMEYFSGKPVN